MLPPRRSVRPRYYFVAYAVIAAALILAHGPLLETPYYWDEIGQFIPASLDLYQTGAWVAHSTLPNVHPPGVMAWLAGFWRIFGYSIEGTRIAMLLIAALGGLFTFLLSIELCRGAPGAPAFAALAFLCVCPLFVAQSMMAQLDMPAMCFSALALLLFLQNRFRASALACVALVLVKETGLVLPGLLGVWLIFEKRARQAVWYAVPALALLLWLLTLRRATGHWFGNAEFARYNLTYPLNPGRLALSLCRRAYYLTFGTGHFIGTAALLYAWRRMPLLRDRAWRVCGAFVALHAVAVSLTGGAVLERYLLPVLPVVYAAFAVALAALMPRARKLALAGLLVCLVCGNFINPVYSFPYENNLAFTDFVSLELRAASAAEGRPGVLATTFPMADAFRRPEFGYVYQPRPVHDIPDFKPASIDSLLAAPPDLMLVYDTTWDPLRLLSRGPVAWFMRRFYGYQPQMSPDAVARELSMRVVRRWKRRGLSMALLERRHHP